MSEGPAPSTITEPGWHGWRLNPASAVLEIRHPQTGNLVYEVDLEECRTSAEVLDWVVQVSHKVWGEHDMAKVVSGLVRALDRVIGLQRHLCGNGVSCSLTTERVGELVALYVGDRADTSGPSAFWYH